MTYGVKYQFSIEATNGDEVDIFLLQRDYSGQKHIRSLGRAPVLKRERNDCILGTSLEIFAECRVDGEFAELYTSDAYEFKVEVYKRQTLQWTGFVSPELYAEPDIAPPYDVQIIATDGLGELKNYDFAFYDRAKSYIAYITSVLEHTGLDLDIEVISGLQYYDEGWSDSNGLGSIVVDLSHKAGESCYEILQQMLKSVNACITQHNGNWLVIRESDIYSQLGSFQIADFGSMNSCDWWPVGNMTTDFIPAKKHLSLTSENYYKPSVLKNSAMASDEGWDKEFNAVYDGAEKAYILPDGGSNIRQTVKFLSEVGYRLFLHISARNAGDGSESQKIGVMIKINGRMYQAGDVFWLKELADAEGRYAWSNTEGYIEFELPEPSDSETRADATDIEVVIPLYKYDSRSYAYATSIEVTIFNADGIHDMYVYECSLMQYEQPLGHKIEASIANGARESMPNVGLLLNDGTYAKPSAEIFRNAIPVAYESEAIITQWKTSAVSAGTYLSVMAKDFAMQVALPRLRYKGNLNVPANQSLPMLFYRDGTYYFLNTYSYDLLNDEVEVELISIPNAAVIIESETITEIASPGSASGTGVGGSGVASGGNEPNLAGLTDVSINTPTDGQVLMYSVGSGKWINWDKKYTLWGASDVSDEPAKDGQVLVYDKASEMWVPKTISVGSGSLSFNDLTDKPNTLAGYGITDAVIYQSGIDTSSAYKNIGYGYTTRGWKTSGPAMVFGAPLYNLSMQCAIADADYVSLYLRMKYNGVDKEWDRVVTEGLLSRGAISFDTSAYKCRGDVVLHRNADDGVTFLNFGPANSDKAALQVFGQNITFYAGVASAYDSYLVLEGDLGNVQVKKPLMLSQALYTKTIYTEGPVILRTTSGDRFFRSRSIDADGAVTAEIGFGVGLNGVNRGIYDYTNGKWLLVNYGDGRVVYQGDKFLVKTTEAYEPKDGYTTPIRLGGGVRIDGSLYLPNKEQIKIANSAGDKDMIIFQLNNNNDFLVGQKTAAEGYDTYLYGNALHLKINKGATELLTLTEAGNVGIGKITPAYKLDINGQLNSANYVVGAALTSDPTESFQTTVFGSNDSLYFKMRLMRPGNASFDRVTTLYATTLCLKSGDTHGYISIPYQESNKNKCYIGGGNTNKINWKGALFHDNMDLLPVTDDSFAIGSASRRYKSLAVSTSVKIGDATLSWDAKAGMLKFDKGLYSVGAITAGKKSSGSQSSGSQSSASAEWYNIKTKRLTNEDTIATDIYNIIENFDERLRDTDKYRVVLMTFKRKQGQGFGWRIPMFSPRYNADSGEILNEYTPCAIAWNNTWWPVLSSETLILNQTGVNITEVINIGANTDRFARSNSKKIRIGFAIFKKTLDSDGNPVGTWGWQRVSNIAEIMLYYAEVKKITMVRVIE